MIDQGELFDIPSPCRRICELNNRGYCKGCFRSRDERLYWNQFTTFQKQLVVNLCEKRRLKVLGAKQQSVAGNEEEIVIPQLDMFALQEEHLSSTPAESANSIQPKTSAAAEPAAEPAAESDQPVSEAVIGAAPQDPGHPQNTSLFDMLAGAEDGRSEGDDTTSTAVSNPEAEQNLATAEHAEEEKEEEKKPRARSQTRTRKADDSQLDMFS